jgi:tyrosyl-tRNA synthetase
MSLTTRWTASQIAEKEKALADGRLHPRDAKVELASEITEIFYGAQAAKEAREQFARVFQQGDIPEEMPEYKANHKQTVLDVLLDAKLAKSKSEARRLIEQGGVRLDGKTLDDPVSAFPGPGVLQVGKRRFIRVEM